MCSTVSEPEPNTFTIANPARVLDAQLKYMSIAHPSRYTPLQPLQGIVMLQDALNGKDEEVVELSELTKVDSTESTAGGEPEPREHAPFEFDITSY